MPINWKLMKFLQSICLIGFALGSLYNERIIEPYNKSIEQLQTRLARRLKEYDYLKKELYKDTININESEENMKILEDRLYSLKFEIERIQNAIRMEEDSISVLSPIILWQEWATHNN